MELELGEEWNVPHLILRFLQVPQYPLVGGRPIVVVLILYSTRGRSSGGGSSRSSSGSGGGGGVAAAAVVVVGRQTMSDDSTDAHAYVSLSALAKKCFDLGCPMEQRKEEAEMKQPGLLASYNATQYKGERRVATISFQHRRCVAASLHRVCWALSVTLSVGCLGLVLGSAGFCCKRSAP